MKPLRYLALFLLVYSGAAVAAAQGKSTPAPTPTTTSETPNVIGVLNNGDLAPGNTDFWLSMIEGLQFSATPNLVDVLNNSGIAPGNTDAWESIIEGLQSLGLIDDDGELLVTGEMYIESLGSADAQATYTNYVMGAMISVRAYEEGMIGVCTLITRAIGTPETGISQAVAAVITSDDEITGLEITDAQSPPRHTTADFFANSDQTFYNPQYVIVLVNEKSLTIWVNGEVFIDHWELENPLPISGAYDEPVMTTVNPEYGCVMTELWAYGF